MVNGSNPLQLHQVRKGQMQNGLAYLQQEECTGESEVHRGLSESEEGCAIKDLGIGSMRNLPLSNLEIGTGQVQALIEQQLADEF